jgi:hypothetical protein
MMIESVPTGCKQDVVPDFEKQYAVMENCGKERFREQEVTKIAENHSRVSRRRPRHTTFDEAYRAPSLFTFAWRF